MRARSPKSERSIASWAIVSVAGTGERELRRLASAQHGLVARTQLLEAGLRPGAITRRIAAGRLKPILPGVYVVGHDALAPLALEMAAVLYYRGYAVLSHRSAAAVWGMAPKPIRAVELTIVGHDARSQTGLRVTRTRALDRRDLRRRDGLPVTSPARTLIDYAGDHEIEATARVLAELRVLELVRDTEISAAMARCPNRKGVAQLRAVMQGEQEPGFTRSEAERRMRAALERAQLPRPEFNSRLHGFEVDVVWQRARLVVEIDGHSFHAPRSAFERDRRRDQILAAAGYTVIRVTWRQLVYEPLAVIARIAQALALAEARAEAWPADRPL